MKQHIIITLFYIVVFTFQLHSQNFENLKFQHTKKTHSPEIEYQLIEEIHFVRNGSNWVNEIKYTYFYDAGNRIQMKIEDWNGSSWVDKYKWIYAYNSNNNLSLAVREQWNGIGWYEDYMKTYTYDSTNHLIEELHLEWINGHWVNDYLFEYVYFFSNNKTSEYWKEWNPLTSSWENQVLISYSYTGNRLDKELWYTDDDGLWDERDLYTYAYNGSNLYQKVHKLALDTSWINYYRYDYFYDSNNNLIGIDTRLWMGGWGDIWVMQDFSYDGNNNLIEYTRQLWQFSNWVYKKRKTYSYQIITEVKQNDAVIHSYQLFNNYPNPFNSETNIEFTVPKKSFVSLSVFDPLGSKIADLLDREKPIGKYNVKFDAANLPSGVYFYKLTAGNYSDTKKMILIK